MITKNQTIPEVVAQYPATRGVFDRYGLHGCGGPLGPQETLEFFALVHKAPLAELLRELEAAVAAPQPAAVEYQESLADVLYKRFFAAAAAVIVTAGAGLGLGALFAAPSRGSLHSLDLAALIQAHASAQVFGWVGLFVMGFAYQGLPRFKYVQLWNPGLAATSLVLMLAGVALRVTAPLPFAWAKATATAGAVLEASAVLAFAVVMARTLSAAIGRESWDRWVRASLLCFVAAALAEPWLTWASLSATLDDAKIRFTADFMAPYRNLQIFGFATMMVLGVGQRILPAAFGFRAVGERASGRALLGALLGLAASAGCWVLFRATGERAWAMGSWAADMLFLGSALGIAVAFGGFTGGAPGRSRKFVHAAFAWLAIGTVLLAFAPVAMATVRAFPHGLYGAARHAIGIGFLSMMIVGVSAKVVPTLKGFDPGAEPGLWAPFALLNGGVILRVTGQAATDQGSRAGLWLAAAGGALATLGFLVWAVYLWRVLARRAPRAAAAGPVEIAPDAIVARIADAFPSTLEVFEEFGFRELKNPFLRNTLGRRITVRAACSMKNVSLEAFLEALRRKAGA